MFIYQKLANLQFLFSAKGVLCSNPCLLICLLVELQINCWMDFNEAWWEDRQRAKE